MPDTFELVKALTQSDIGNVLVQEQVDKAIADLANRNNPLRQNLPRKKGSGNAYIVTQRTPGSTLAVAVNDTEDLPEGKGSFSRVSFAYKTLGVKIAVSRRARKISQSYVDAAREEIEVKTEEFKAAEEQLLFRGDATSNPKEFDGLDQLIPLAQRVVATTTSGAMTLEDIDEAIDLVRGNVNLILCSRKCARKLNALLQANQRFVDRTEIKGGFRVMAYQDAPVLKSTAISDTMVFGADKSVSAYTGGKFTAMYFLNTEDVFVAELTPLTIEKLDKTSSQAEKWDMYEDITLVMRNSKAASMLTGIYVP